MLKNTIASANGDAAMSSAAGSRLALIPRQSLREVGR